MTTWRQEQGPGRGGLRRRRGLGQHKTNRVRLPEMPRTQQEVNQQKRSPAMETGAYDWVSQASGPKEPTQEILKPRDSSCLEREWALLVPDPPVYQERGCTPCKQELSQRGQESDRKMEAGQQRGLGRPAAGTLPEARMGPGCTFNVSR